MKRAVIRLPSDVVDRLDRLAEELRVAHPEESYSRASVVRALISGGLTLAETDTDRLIEAARRSAHREGGSVAQDGGSTPKPLGEGAGPKPPERPS